VAVQETRELTEAALSVSEEMVDIIHRHVDGDMTPPTIGLTMAAKVDGSHRVAGLPERGS